MKIKCTIEFHSSCYGKCTLCGKTFSGEESAVHKREVMHIMFRHPIKFAKCMWGGKDSDKNA